jgi:prepilin-type N-terminal cleavage/methylation domain-containing protein
MNDGVSRTTLMIKTNGDGGFTLIEVLVVIFILTLLAPLGLPDLRYKVQQARVNTLSTETGILSIAVVNSYDDNSVWPGGPTCATAFASLSTSILPATPYLSDVDATNVFNNAITTSCTLNEFTITQNVNPSFMLEAVQSLGGTSVVNALTGTIRTTIPRPANSAGHDDLLPRDGSRPMVGDLDMDTNAIVDAGDITADRLIDRQDPNYIVDPASTSAIGTRLRNLSVDDSINSLSGDLELNASAGNRVVVGGNGILVNSGTVTASYYGFNASATIGGTCSAGQIGMSITPNLLICSGGRWVNAAAATSPTITRFSCSDRGSNCSLGNHDVCMLTAFDMIDGTRSNRRNRCNVFGVSSGAWQLRADRSGETGSTTCTAVCMDF